MDGDGNIRVVERYKDMTIRGGMNTSPLSIERILSEIEGLDVKCLAHPLSLKLLTSKQVQIVGCRDNIAGELPIAVYQSKTSVCTKAMQNIILKAMGSTRVPDEFLRLRDLALTDWSKTSSGKVQKTRLAELVREYKAARRPSELNGHSESLQKSVLHIWSGLLGLSQEELDADTPIQQLTHIITIMHFRDRMKKDRKVTDRGRNRAAQYDW